MKHVAAGAVLVVVETLALHSPTGSLWVWCATALFLFRRALVLYERTHLVLSVWGHLLGALGSIALVVLAWRGYTVLAFPARWQLYSGVLLAGILVLQLVESRTNRIEWSAVGRAVADASFWDLATSRCIPDLRNRDISIGRLGA